VSMDTSGISCPASDGSHYTSSGGSERQIQCSTSYDDSTLNTVSASSLADCVATCEALGTCVGASWSSSSQQCALKGSMVSDSYAIGDLAHSFIRLSKLPPASNVLSNTQFVGGKYSTSPNECSKEGWFDLVDCTDQRSMGYMTDYCRTGQTILHSSYGYVLQSSWARYSALSQVANLVPGYEYRLSVTAGYHNTDQNCVVKYMLDDDVFWSGIPVNTGGSPQSNQASAWRNDGPYSVIAKKESQTFKFSMECPNAQNNNGWAWWTDVNFVGPYEVK
jgi:hypothetical protein